MAKGDSLKRYKIEQKAQTRKRIEEAIETLKSAQSDKKITVAQVAALSGITRASIYANYKDLIERLKSSTNKNSVNLENNVKDKNEVISKLREENKDLRFANQKLMDQVVALRKLLNQ